VGSETTGFENWDAKPKPERLDMIAKQVAFLDRLLRNPELFPGTYDELFVMCYLEQRLKDEMSQAKAAVERAIERSGA